MKSVRTAFKAVTELDEASSFQNQAPPSVRPVYLLLLAGADRDLIRSKLIETSCCNSRKIPW
jgi:hypothetical protein